MSLFKEKCSHIYEEIGKYYDRIDYGNGTSINSYIVKKCKICGNITANTTYSNEFTPYTSSIIAIMMILFLTAEVSLKWNGLLMESENIFLNTKSKELYFGKINSHNAK